MAITYRKLSADGDYTFGVGRGGFWTDQVEAVAQAVRTRLLLWAGEWFLDTEEGTAYNPLGLGKFTLETAAPMIRARVLGTDGVKEIVTFEPNFDPETRKLAVTLTLNTDYGVTDFTVGIR